MILVSLLKERTEELRLSYSTCMSLYMDDHNVYGIVTSGHLRILLNYLNMDMHLISPCLNWILWSLIISTLKIYVSVYNFDYTSSYEFV